MTSRKFCCPNSWAFFTYLFSTLDFSEKEAFSQKKSEGAQNVIETSNSWHYPKVPIGTPDASMASTLGLFYCSCQTVGFCTSANYVFSTHNSPAFSTVTNIYETLNKLCSMNE